MLTLIVTLLVVLQLIAIAVMVVGAVRAPLGYQDKTGFHSLEKPVRVATPRRPRNEETPDYGGLDYHSHHRAATNPPF